LSNAFLSLPMPPGNDPGASIDTSNLAAQKTFTITGEYTGRVIVEASSDGTNYAVTPVFFDGPSGEPITMTVELACTNIRIQREIGPTPAGIPTVTVAAIQEPTESVILPLPSSQAAPGTAVDTSLLGNSKTIVVSGDYFGVLIVSGSADNTTFNPIPGIDIPGPGTYSFAAIYQFMRIEKLTIIEGDVASVTVCAENDINGGSQGPQGSSGAQGATGFSGGGGSSGGNGAQGSPGVAGPQGHTGLGGAQGAQGAQGAGGGPQGNTGAQGVTGAQGAQGTQGAGGIHGAQGAVGAQGAQGSNTLHFDLLAAWGFGPSGSTANIMQGNGASFWLRPYTQAGDLFTPGLTDAFPVEFYMPFHSTNCSFEVNVSDLIATPGSNYTVIISKNGANSGVGTVISATGITPSAGSDTFNLGDTVGIKIISIGPLSSTIQTDFTVTVHFLPS
jgi:hypothetical protein